MLAELHPLRALLLAASGLVNRHQQHVIEYLTYAERFVLSIKSECLDRMIFFGEQSLRRSIREYLDHYHAERAHQGLGNRHLASGPMGEGDVECQERLGGILEYDYRAA